jgi:hypothetical protein
MQKYQSSLFVWLILKATVKLDGNIFDSTLIRIGLNTRATGACDNIFLKCVKNRMKMFDFRTLAFGLICL